MFEAIDLTSNPDIIVLKRDEEELEDFYKINKEELLLRWFNHHLKNAGQPEIKNLNSHLKGGNAYTYLLDQLQKGQGHLDNIQKEPLERCEHIVQTTNGLGIPKCIQP